ncbi:unnamed protein product [Gongylonema pulchrum]|uniref:Protein arginine methyltransferase NDUFAF7 n=1 Tax=Gongylonema pulchrum TaxID=637853 RepID=A0A3P7QWI8_9BILA|nr:unnamed protein product [Gongylonema pulchrum]
MVESGPGTGQLMLDLTRVLKQLKHTQVSVHLVETSDALVLQQESLLCEQQSQFVVDKPYIRSNRTRYDFPVYWYRSVDDIPAKFSVFICNEFLDALPINQFRKDAEGKWHEVCVALDTNDNLCFMLSKAENLHTL